VFVFVVQIISVSIASTTYFLRMLLLL